MPPTQTPTQVSLSPTFTWMGCTVSWTPIRKSNCTHMNGSTGQSFHTFLPCQLLTISTHLWTINSLPEQRTTRQPFCALAQNIFYSQPILIQCISWGVSCSPNYVIIFRNYCKGNGGQTPKFFGYFLLSGVTFLSSIPASTSRFLCILDLWSVIGCHAEATDVSSCWMPSKPSVYADTSADIQPLCEIALSK